MASCGYVKEQFAWRHYYFYLTSDGITYLREYLGLPEDVFPATHHQTKSEQPKVFGEKGGARGAFITICLIKILNYKNISLKKVQYYKLILIKYFYSFF